MTKNYFKFKSDLANMPPSKKVFAALHHLNSITVIQYNTHAVIGLQNII